MCLPNGLVRHRSNIAIALMAPMTGTLPMHGIRPGPQIMAARPQLVWGMASMLLVINLPSLSLNLCRAAATKPARVETTSDRSPMHKVIIAACTVTVALGAIFMVHARQTTAAEQRAADMPSIQYLTLIAKEMPQQSFPAF